LADDYVYTDSSGRVTNKADSLRQARSTTGRMKAFQTSDEKTLIYGDMAIITGRLRVEGVAGGEPYDTEVRFTDILARIDGQWRAVAAHASKR
jgi:ketosteroid isomerase-like protein